MNIEITFVVNFLCKHFYVDDGLYSVGTVQEAIQLVNAARELCTVGNLRLHKFVSNSKELLEHIPESERAVATQSIDINFDHLPTERALGIRWDTDQHTFKLTYNHISMEEPINRRKVLSIVASLFDPLGCVAPFVLKGKVILQQVMQNAALRTATRCTQDTNIQHLHDETLTLPIHEHLQLHASQYKQKTQHPSHPLHKHTTYFNTPRLKNPLFLTTAATQQTFPQTPTQSLQQT